MEDSTISDGDGNRYSLVCRNPYILLFNLSPGGIFAYLIFTCQVYHLALARTMFLKYPSGHNQAALLAFNKQ